MKKIAFFGVKTFPSRGGTDRVAENLINQLKDRYDILLYCFKDPAAQNNLLGIKVIEFRRLVPGGIGSFIYFFCSALHLLFKGDVDIVHIHKTESTFFAPLLRLRFKVVSTSHEAQYRSDKWNAFAKMFFHLVEWIYIKSSNVCTCISMPLTEYYVTTYGKKVIFIPNGINRVDPDTFDVPSAQTFLPPGASLYSPFILFSARRLMRVKGCHTMLEALNKIKYTGQVFITGELHGSDEYWSQLKELATGLNVFFLGFVNPLPTLLALVYHADLFIFPSETEGMSIMLLEVASVGKPIIASDIPENKQVFDDTEVIYFKSKDALDLAEKLTHAFNSPQTLQPIATNCQKKVFSEYLWTNIAESYARVYDALF